MYYDVQLSQTEANGVDFIKFTMPDEYYDIEVRLTQGWFAVHRDLENEVAAVVLFHTYQNRGHVARIVSHIVAL